jgi:hypothetical protein
MFEESYRCWIQVRLRSCAHLEIGESFDLFKTGIVSLLRPASSWLREGFVPSASSHAEFEVCFENKTNVSFCDGADVYAKT